jgi:hypothetical protein
MALAETQGRGEQTAVPGESIRGRMVRVGALDRMIPAPVPTAQTTARGVLFRTKVGEKMLAGRRSRRRSVVPRWPQFPKGKAGFLSVFRE